MATKEQIGETYGPIGKFRKVYKNRGISTDLSCARFLGDFSLSLTEAQEAKFAFISGPDGLSVQPGDLVLDVGCGNGEFIEWVNAMGAVCYGLTKDRRQARSAQERGLRVKYAGWEDIDPAQVKGRFSSITATESLEHFCSIPDLIAGKQDEIYRRFFQWCSDALSDEGSERLYVQSMVWGDGKPPNREISRHAPRGSSGRIVAKLGTFYKGSFGAYGSEQIIRHAPDFDVVSMDDGQKDYIETMERFGEVHNGLSLDILWAKAQALALLAKNRDAFSWIESLQGGYNKECFRRDILRLPRIVFQKKH